MKQFSETNRGVIALVLLTMGFALTAITARYLIPELPIKIISAAVSDCWCRLFV